MPTDNVFTKSHDEAIGMIGNTLDFIAGESAKAAAQQKTQEFQQGEYQKERDFRSGEGKKKHARDMQSQVSLDYIKNLRSIGTSEALKLADQKSQELAKDPEGLNFAMTGGLNDLGLDVSTLGKQYPGVEPFMPPGTKRITMDQWQKEIQPLYQAHRNVLSAKNDKEKADRIRMAQQIWNQMGTAKLARGLGISQTDLPTGEIDANGHPIYGGGYAKYADEYMDEMDKLISEGNRSFINNELPREDLYRRMGSLGNADNWIRNRGDVVKTMELQGQSAETRAKLKSLNEEERSLTKRQSELDSFFKEHGTENFWKYPFKFRTERDELKEVKKKLVKIREEAATYDVTTKTIQEELKKKNTGKGFGGLGLDLFPDIPKSNSRPVAGPGSGGGLY